MKKIFSVSGLLACAMLVMSFGFQAEVLKFEKTTHSFGKVKQNTPVTVEFAFTNQGTKPVIIEDATAECGCTKPEFPPRPIAPGKGGVIKVTYDSKTMGSFTKKVTVKLVNDSKPVELLIKGEVVS
jgi:Protein of unknown function (DUF1573)